jgi:hypothetical protein
MEHCSGVNIMIVLRTTFKVKEAKYAGWNVIQQFTGDIIQNALSLVKFRIPFYIIFGYKILD